MIGALSLVIVVWLGTSMNCSRMSTLTGRSTIGMRNRRPGSRTIDSFVLPEPEDDHPLVLLHDPDRQVQDDEQDDGDEREGRERGDDLHELSSVRRRCPPATPADEGWVRCRLDRPDRLDDRGQPVEADEPDVGIALEMAGVGRTRRPWLTAEQHGPGGLERGLDDPRGARRHGRADRARRRPDPAAQVHAAGRERHQDENGDELH